MTTNETIDALKLKLKSVTKLKLQREKELCNVRDKERSLNEELEMVKGQNKFLSEHLQDIVKETAQAKHKISMIEIYSSSEDVKIQGHISQLENHTKGFQDFIDKERNYYEHRMQEMQEKEATEEEILRQKEREAAERRESRERDAAAIEAECDSIERECAVLKKRNNAIMLKLRRKLLETESARREIMKRNRPSVEN